MPTPSNPQNLNTRPTPEHRGFNTLGAIQTTIKETFANSNACLLSLITVDFSVFESADLDNTGKMCDFYACFKSEFYTSVWLLLLKSPIYKAVMNEGSSRSTFKRKTIYMYKNVSFVII